MAGGVLGVLVRAGLHATSLCVLLSACSNDLDSLYVHGLADGGSTKAASLPLLPAQPDEDTIAACEACAKDQCADARANCLEDDACRAMLSCKGRCSDPACLRTCEYENEFSPWYDDYFVCVLRRRCVADCKGGENWACAGKYRWPVAEKSRFTERFLFSLPKSLEGDPTNARGNFFVVGAAARACDDVPCEDFHGLLSQGRVDVSNRVELELVTGGKSFNGFLELEDPDLTNGVREHVYGQPIWRTGDVIWIAPDPSWQFPVTVLAKLGPSFDFATAAPLVGLVVDCLGTGAPNVELVLPALPTMSPMNGSLFADIPADVRVDPISLQASVAGNAVAERKVQVAAGWITYAVLAPQEAR